MRQLHHRATKCLYAGWSFKCRKIRSNFLSFPLLHLFSSSLPYFPHRPLPPNITFILFYAFIHSLILISDSGPPHCSVNVWQVLLPISRSSLTLSLPPWRLLSLELSSIFLQRQTYPTEHSRAQNWLIHSSSHLVNTYLLIPGSVLDSKKINYEGNEKTRPWK